MKKVIIINAKKGDCMKPERYNYGQKPDANRDECPHQHTSDKDTHIPKHCKCFIPEKNMVPSQIKDKDNKKKK